MAPVYGNQMMYGPGQYPVQQQPYGRPGMMPPGPGAYNPYGQPGAYGQPMPYQQPMMPQPVLQPGVTPSQTSAQMALNTAMPAQVVQHVPVAGCPPGLETLIPLEALFIQQEVEILEALFDFETNNRYSVFDPSGFRLFFVGENTPCCDRWCLGARRPFLIHIWDAYGRPIMDLERQCSCAMCYFGPGCYGSDVTVTLRATGECLGVVAQNCSPCTPGFTVIGPGGNEALEIRGPACGACCPIVMCCDATFEILVPGSQEPVGTILKNFTWKEMFTDANNFGFRVRGDLDVSLKALLLAAVFCIDFAYFESSGGGGWGDRGGHGYGQRGGGGGGGQLNGFWLTVLLIFLFIILFFPLYYSPMNNGSYSSSSSGYNNRPSYG